MRYKKRKRYRYRIALKDGHEVSGVIRARGESQLRRKLAEIRAYLFEVTLVGECPAQGRSSGAELEQYRYCFRLKGGHEITGSVQAPNKSRAWLKVVEIRFQLITETTVEEEPQTPLRLINEASRVFSRFDDIFKSTR